MFFLKKRTERSKRRREKVTAYGSYTFDFKKTRVKKFSTLDTEGLKTTNKSIRLRKESKSEQSQLFLTKTDFFKKEKKMNFSLRKMKNHHQQKSQKSQSFCGGWGNSSDFFDDQNKGQNRKKGISLSTPTIQRNLYDKIKEKALKNYRTCNKRNFRPIFSRVEKTKKSPTKKIKNEDFEDDHFLRSTYNFQLTKNRIRNHSKFHSRNISKIYLPKKRFVQPFFCPDLKNENSTSDSMSMDENVVNSFKGYQGDFDLKGITSYYKFLSKNNPHNKKIDLLKSKIQNHKKAKKNSVLKKIDKN